MKTLLNILSASILRVLALLLSACNGMNYGQPAHVPPVVAPGYG